jgi:hypothetical protein
VEEIIMSYQVIVSFGPESEYDFKFGDTGYGSNESEARAWLDKEFKDMHCEITSPTGKVLIIDKLLAVARAAGAERFASASAWAQQYVHNVAQVIRRDLVRVDVAGNRIGC